MTSRYSTFVILLGVLFMTSCKELRKSIDETLHPVAQKKTAPTDSNSASSSITFSSSSVFSSSSEQNFNSIFESAATLDSIQQELYNMPGFKGKKLFFMAGIYFYDYRGGIISVDLQDPNNPENVDTYTYSNGEWEIQKPVKTTSNPHFPLKMLLMPLDEIKFSTAKKVYDIAWEKTKAIEGVERTQHVYFSQIKAVHVKEWYVMIRTARRDYRITFDVDGNFRGMR